MMLIYVDLYSLAPAAYSTHAEQRVSPSSVEPSGSAGKVERFGPWRKLKGINKASLNAPCKTAGKNTF